MYELNQRTKFGQLRTDQSCQGGIAIARRSGYRGDKSSAGRFNKLLGFDSIPEVARTLIISARIFGTASCAAVVKAPGASEVQFAAATRKAVDRALLRDQPDPGSH